MTGSKQGLLQGVEAEKKKGQGKKENKITEITENKLSSAKNKPKSETTFR